jgi:hypothetical protein
MKQPIKPTKKKISVNGKMYKVPYEVFLLIRNQSSESEKHIDALYKYVTIYDAASTHTEEEEILYNYCMQQEIILRTVEYVNNLKKEDAKV